MNPHLYLFYMLLEPLQLNTCSQKEKFKVIKMIWAFDSTHMALNKTWFGKWWRIINSFFGTHLERRLATKHPAPSTQSNSTINSKQQQMEADLDDISSYADTDKDDEEGDSAADNTWLGAYTSKSTEKDVRSYFMSRFLKYLTLSGPSFLKLPSPQGQIFLDLESVLQPKNI